MESLITKDTAPPATQLDALNVKPTASADAAFQDPSSQASLDAKPAETTSAKESTPSNSNASTHTGVPTADAVESQNLLFCRWIIETETAHIIAALKRSAVERKPITGQRKTTSRSECSKSCAPTATAEETPIQKEYVHAN